MQTIDHKFIGELKKLEQEKIFANRSIIGQNKLLIVGTFNPSACLKCKKNNAEWFYGRKANNLWRYIPEAIINKSLKEHKKEDWIKFCNNNKIVIIDLVKSARSNQKLNSFSDKDLESLISRINSKPIFFDSKQAFNQCKFDYVIFTRKIWDSKIPMLKKAKEELINNLLKLESIKSIENQIIYCPAPWGNFKKRAEEWSNKMQIMQNK
jgi:hypothetical protein